MAKKTKSISFNDALQWFRNHGFTSGEKNGVTFLSKYNCAAGISRAADGSIELAAKPGYVLGGEIAKLVDRGYQKFLHTSKLEVPATSDHLKTIHEFSEEFREALGLTSLYNESLGSVSDRYVYDRVRGRAENEPHIERPWEKAH